MPPDLLHTTDAGLACPLGGFHIDPWRPVPLALVTHAHSDHARPGSGRYLCAAEGIGVMRQRLGAGAVVEGVPYGQRVRLGDVAVSFHPAGHVHGSAQIRVESADAVWVASGDYKREADPTCAAFEVVPCDAFISEATFALPIYRWRPTAEVVDELVEWWRANAAEGKVSALFCYALGKAQRVLAELARRGELPRREAFVHGSVMPLVEDYRAAGIELLPTRRVTDDETGDEAARASRPTADAQPTEQATPEPVQEPAESEAPRTKRRTRRRDAAEYAGSLILAPPSAAGSPWMRRFGPAAMVDTGFVSGWMRVRGIRRRRGYDRGFVLSDHADWPGLLRTIEQTGARRVLATHGSSDVLSRHLRQQGLDAGVLETRYAAEEDDG